MHKYNDNDNNSSFRLLIMLFFIRVHNKLII